MGFSDGEAFVWASRSGKYIDRDGNPVDIIKNPRMEGSSEWTLTTSAAGRALFGIGPDGKIQEVIS